MNYDKRTGGQQHSSMPERLRLGIGFLEGARCPLAHQLGDLGEHCMLPPAGSGVETQPLKGSLAF